VLSCCPFFIICVNGSINPKCCAKVKDFKSPAVQSSPKKG
jgi:hypothetical protein